MVTEHCGPAVHLHFDLDDTLAHTAKAFRPSWRDPSVLEIVQTLVPDLSHEEVLHFFKVYYESHGCSWLGIADNFGLPMRWVDEAYDRHGDASLKLIADLEVKDRLPSLLDAASEMVRLRILTQAGYRYAESVLDHLGVRHHFPILRARAYKRTAQPYHIILAEEGRHEAKHWLIEDSPANLKEATRLGFTTVLVGPRDGEADYCFPDVEAFLESFIAGSLTP